MENIWWDRTLGQIQLFRLFGGSNNGKLIAKFLKFEEKNLGNLPTIHQISMSVLLYLVTTTIILFALYSSISIYHNPKCHVL